MATPIQFRETLTRRVLADELDEIEKLMARSEHAAVLRIRELRLAVERKPFDIDTQ